jgi:hypothetical protein
MFEFALKEWFASIDAAMQYFFGSVAGQLKLGWNIGTHDTFYVFESSDEGITVVKWDESLDLDFEMKRLTQNVHKM